MSEYSRRELARTAGVDIGYVDQLVELAILRPRNGDAFSSGDVLRARWIYSLEKAGVSLEGMAAALRDGALSLSFLDVSLFDRFAGHSDTTFQQVSDTTGIPLDLLAVVREAFGYAEPRPEDYVREAELSVVSMVEHQLSKGYHQAVIERLLRVYAESLRRIVETEAEAYSSEVSMPRLGAGMSEGEMLEVVADPEEWSLAPLAEDALLAIYRGQQEHAWKKGAVEAIEAALERAGLHSRLHRPPAVSFLDLTGYTKLTEERGDRAAADLATELKAVVRRSALGHGGESVKWLGDGVMFYFPEPGDGVLAALDMVEGAAAHALPPARVGIHAGAVILQDGDYLGRTVNIAARIADYARPGEVLVSQEVVEAALGIPVTFNEIGPVELKGVAGALSLHTAHRAN